MIDNKFKNIIGADETGVGDYLTPLVVAAVYIPPQNYADFIKLGVQDSKNLTNQKILVLFEKIKLKIKSSVRSMNQTEYNLLNQKYNAHELKTLLHLDAINSLSQRVNQLDLVLIDQYANEKNMNLYLAKIFKHQKIAKSFKAPIKYLIHGETQHLSIAAASIVARAHFLKLMEQQNKQWNTNFPLGTNLKVEMFAKKFVEQHGKSALSKVAKLSFKTTNKILV